MVAESDTYTPAFDEPALSIRGAAELIGGLRDMTDVRAVSRYLAFMMVDHLEPDRAWALARLDERFGPFESADAEPIAKLFRGRPGRLFG